MTIKNSVLNPNTHFNLDGLEYSKDLFMVTYGGIQVDSNGEIVKDNVTVGIRHKHDFTIVLSNNKPVNTWSDGTSNFTNLDDLMEYLGGVISFSLGGGTGVEIPITQRVNVVTELEVGENEGDLAYVKESSGTSWLPYTLGGTYYPAGWYVWDGEFWVSDRNAIANQLEDLILSGNTYQEILVSGNNIKTINNQSLLGSGNIAVNGKFVDGTNPSDAVYMVGNVGIGIAAPVSKFQIHAGRMSFSGTNDCIYIGVGSGISDTLTTTSDNICIGRDTMMNPSGSNRQNIAIGTNALKATGSGRFSNVAVGYNALPDCDANQNVAVGAGVFGKLNSSSGNVRNVGVGNNAGTNALSGSNLVCDNSIFIGHNSVALSSGQTNQIVIGSGAEGQGSNSVVLGHTDILNTYLRGRVRTNSPIRLTGYTVATLPVGGVGDIAFVTDLSTPTYNSIAVGGGTIKRMVQHNGTNWVT